MVFWVGILAAALFAWFAVKMGFYEAWAMLFNILISVYLAVFLTPVISEAIPAAGETAFGSALTLVAVAIGTFIILYVISYTFLTGQFTVTLPKIFDNLGSGILGFLGGFLVWSFLTLVISVTPVSQNSFAQGIGFGRPIQQTTMPYLAWWCNLANRAAASADSRRSTQETVGRLLDNATKIPSDKATARPDPNMPVKQPRTRTDREKEPRRPPLRRPAVEDF